MTATAIKTRGVGSGGLVVVVGGVARCAAAEEVAWVAEKKVVNSRFELDELPIARGGMGEVWLGRDVRLERQVAVKFLRFPDGKTDPELIRRFVRESRITARLEHPGVPAIFDVGTDEGRPYIVMQRVHGLSVSELVAEQGHLPIGWAVAIAAQACAVLAAAHRASLVHRDLKPANLMLEPDGTVKVLDFGLAVGHDVPGISNITRTGQTLGTPAYMAPEQILAAMSGPATDLYALGCTLYEMLAGSRPFTGSTAYAVMRQQVDQAAPPVRQMRPDVPAGLERLLAELLEKDPENRPASAEAVYERLLPFVTDLRPILGVHRPTELANPVRMYAGVVSHVLTGTVDPADGHGAVPAQRPASFDLDRLRTARSEAQDLAADSRFLQAADVLAVVVGPAGEALGAIAQPVIDLRLSLADIRFEGGDYRSAAPEYRQLAVDLAALVGPGDAAVLRCRLQEATCNALIGQAKLAVRQISELLADEERLFGTDDQRVLELRHQLGLLQLGAGQRVTGQRTLARLLEDLDRVKGADDAGTVAVRSLMDDLERKGR